MADVSTRCRFDEPENYCGLQRTVSDRETRRGTNYEIAKWTCPNCGRACSCVYVDDEFVHGDGLYISYGPEKEPDGKPKRHYKCGTCWLDAEKAALDASPSAPLSNPLIEQTASDGVSKTVDGGM